jgi:4-amino-4-deoxy-L-arabinose transferase-like glycosyltransferase
MSGDCHVEASGNISTSETARCRSAFGHFIRQPGLILAVISFLVGLLWMAVIQPLDAPDEPGHLQAIMQVRKQYILPEIHYLPSNPGREIPGPPGDPETRAYIAKLLPKLPVNEQYFPVPYESFQPPLYYLAAGLVAQLVPPDPQTVLYIGRLVAILFGAATVYFCWLTTRELAPQAPMWAIASAGVVALLPQFCFNSAHASNDSTVNLTATAAFYVWIRGVRHPEFDRRLLGAGAMLGLALLSKLTAVALIPGLALVIIFRMFQARPSTSGVGNWVKRGLYMIVGATLGTALVCGWWFLRNVFTYGEPAGTAAALRFFAGKFIKADFTRPRTAGDLLRYTLENLWGRFGWNDITLPQEVYRVCNSAALLLVGLTVLAGIGLVVRWAVRKRPALSVAKGSPDVTWQASLIFLVVGLTLFGGYIQFNQKVGYQPQARYFFIMLLPGALLLTGGLYALAAKRAFRMAAFGILFIALSVLNTLALVIVSKAGPAYGGVRYVMSSGAERSPTGCPDLRCHFWIACACAGVSMYT